MVFEFSAPKIGGRLIEPTLDLVEKFFVGGVGKKPQTTNNSETLQTKSCKVGAD